MAAVKSNSVGPEIDPPAKHVLEVSLFGPGYGESIVIHAGDGDWLVVDSCVTGDKKTPAALSYLESIGVDPASAVKLVVATHWHDDHVRGIAVLYQACHNAGFSFSQALQNEKLATLAIAAHDHAGTETSGADEYLSVLYELSARGDSPEWAIANKRLWNRVTGIPGQLWALSPSNQLVSQALQSIGQLLIPDNTPSGRIPTPRENDAAVALWLSVGGVAVLLGADLERTGSTTTGWSAVIASQSRPQGRASVYKISHHGAASADVPEIWDTLLVDQPVAMLTPFTLGKVSLPTSDDIQRLQTRTTKLFTTARVASKRAITGSGPVARTKREVLVNCHRLTTEPGQVRVRLDLHNATEQVDLFGSATMLPG